MSIFDRVLAQRIKQAKSEDQDSRVSAVTLLRNFVEASEESVSPMLIAYLQGCIKAWLGSDCNPRAASAAFNVAQPPHRPNDEHVFEKRSRAIRCYHLLRARGRGRDVAIAGAAKYANVSGSTIKKLLEEIAASPREFDEEPSPVQLINTSVLAEIGSRNQAVLNRCLHPRRKPYQRSR